MSEQSEAFRLAALCDTGALINTEWDDVAGELRRLHAEVNEQARLNGMGAERELALMAKVEAATRARQQAQEALYAERDRCAKVVQRLQAARMTDIDIADDDALRFVQRVLETNAPEADRLDARAKVSAIRTRVLKARATSQPEPAPVAATSAMVPMKLVEINDVGLAPAVIKPFTPAQRRRLWDNSKEHHKDAANITGFERIVTLTERAHGIGLTVGDTE